MAYVKISDPYVIDLTAWHQVINVVNQHSDSLSAITNNFGGTGASVDYSLTDTAHRFDIGSMQILFGRATSTSSDSPTGGTTSMYYNTVNFADSATGAQAFNGTPVVTITAQSGGQSGSSTPASTNEDVIASVYAVTTDSFSYRLFRSGSTKPITGTVYVNWTAIGPS